MRDWGLRRRRRRLIRKLGDNALSRFASRPLPSGSTLFWDAELVCLDMETSGLDPLDAEMLSIGWVLIRKGRVDLSTAASYVVRPTGEVGDSATVHGLTDTICEAGDPMISVLDKALEVLNDRVLVVHHAGLDKAILDRMCRHAYGDRLPIPVIDTMQLEYERRTRQHHVNNQNSLRLADLRHEYHLPAYRAHNCLTDAIATAELLLAIVATAGTPKATKLRDLYT